MSNPPMSSRKSILASGAIGSILEWYDFALYAFLATVLAKHYFPSGDPTVSLIAAFGVFAGGYLMRPVGGVLLGHIGDRISRKTALIVSVSAMSVATTAIAVLPGYAQIGIAAPLLLTMLRLIQGLAVGGEYTGAVVLLVETAPPKRRAVFASLALTAGTGGVLLASGAAGLGASVMPADMFESWGWRLLYLPAPLLGIVALVMRSKLQVPGMDTAKAERSVPVVDILVNHRPALLRLTGLSATVAITNYTVFIYGSTYLETVALLPRPLALNINTIGIAVLAVFLVSTAWLSDKIGRRPVMLVSALGVAVSAVPLFMALRTGDPTVTLISLFGFAVFLGGCGGALSGIMCELFPRSVRFTGASLGYSLAFGIFGGTAPLVSETLISATGNTLSPGFYVSLAGLVGVLTILLTPETRNRSLD